jgi:hypothetical protein
MRVSTFELLLKPITPATPEQEEVPNREALAQSDRFVLQGYFLTIANPSDTDLDLRLRFTATVSRSVRDSEANNVTLDNLIDRTFVFLDLGLGEGGNGIEGNVPGDLTRIEGTNQFEFEFTLPGSKTAFFLVQPDIIPRLQSSGGVEKTEIRGFTEIFLDFPLSQIFELLITPEHRGTFLPPMLPENMGKMQGMKKLISDFDQLVYTLPTPTGGSLFTLGPTLPGIEMEEDESNTENAPSAANASQ